MRRGTGKRGSTHAVLGVFIKNDGLELGVLTGVKATGANLTPQHHDNRAHAERTQPLTSAPTLMLANPVSVLNISQNVVLPVAGVPVTKIFGREREEADIPGNALVKLDNGRGTPEKCLGAPRTHRRLECRRRLPAVSRVYYAGLL